jgi:hypothetical protein
MPPDGRPRKTKPLDSSRMSEATTRGPGHRKEDWITLQFRRVYDDALRDSVPREMLDLVNKLDGRGEDAPEHAREDEVSGKDDDDKDGGGNA